MPLRAGLGLGPCSTEFEIPARRVRAKFGERRLARDRLGSHRYQGSRRVGHINIHARTEADQAEPVPSADNLALADKTDNAPCDKSGDLHNPETAAAPFDDEAVALVVLARLVEVGVEEKAWPIGDLRHPAADRRAIYMAVEHRHENGNPLHRFGAQGTLRRGARR